MEEALRGQRLPARGENLRCLSCPFNFPRDNVEWSEEQAAEAERKVQENSTQRVCQEKQGAPRWTLSGIDSLRTAGRALRRGQGTEAPRVFVTGLKQNSHRTRRRAVGEGLCLDILLGHKGCFGFAFLFGRG